MKITNLEVYELKIPFSIGIKSSSADFLKQDGMDFCVIKILVNEMYVTSLGAGQYQSQHNIVNSDIQQ